MKRTNDQDFHPSSFDEHILQWHKPPPVRNEMRPRFTQNMTTKPVKPVHIRPQPQQIRPQPQQTRPQISSHIDRRYLDSIRPNPYSLLSPTEKAIKAMIPTNFTFNADIFRALNCPFCAKIPISRKGS